MKIPPIIAVVLVLAGCASPVSSYIDRYCAITTPEERALYREELGLNPDYETICPLTTTPSPT